MPVDRPMWSGIFDKEDLPHYPCHRCCQQALTLISNSLREEDDADTVHGRDHEEWAPECSTGRFVAFLKCAVPKCHETVAVMGRTNVGHTYDAGGEYYPTRYEPLAFLPALPLISVPKGAPDDVHREIAAACGLYRLDSAAAANRIRASLERLMDFHKIPDKTAAGGWIDLHHRLTKYAQSQGDNDLETLLIATKWLGNAGVHGHLTLNDLFDAFDLLEYTLHRMFDVKSATLLALGKKINLNKGPIP